MRMTALVHFSIQRKVAAPRPQSPHLMVELVAVDTLSMDWKSTINRQQEIKRPDSSRSRGEKLRELVHGATLRLMFAGILALAMVAWARNSFCSTGPPFGFWHNQPAITSESITGQGIGGIAAFLRKWRAGCNKTANTYSLLFQYNSSGRFHPKAGGRGEVGAFGQVRSCAMKRLLKSPLGTGIIAGPQYRECASKLPDRRRAQPKCADHSQIRSRCGCRRCSFPRRAWHSSPRSL
jgi:hypothetical protein